MSLVGPRPYLARQRKDMGIYYDIIIQDKPGLTGLWQVSGRSDVSFQERLEMDIEYHNNRSFRYDMKILFKTFSAVLKSKGAM